jgi:hypothetical protein
MAESKAEPTRAERAMYSLLHCKLNDVKVEIILSKYPGLDVVFSVSTVSDRTPIFSAVSERLDDALEDIARQMIAHRRDALRLDEVSVNNQRNGLAEAEKLIGGKR